MRLLLAVTAGYCSSMSSITADNYTEHRVLEYWVVQCLRLALSEGPNRVGFCPTPSPKDGTRGLSETLGFLVFRIPNDG
jgi:hypothetical protein